jgi:hypothetical protein
MKPRSGRSLFAACCVFVFMGCASVRQRVAIETLPPQITPYSCQSNFFAQALSRQYPSDYPVKTAEDLVRLEMAIRREIERAAGGQEVTHAHWDASIRTFTGGKYRFVEHAFRNAENALRLMRSITEGAQAVAGVSVTRIEGETYPSGHVVTVLNVEEDGTLTLFNSWVKKNGVPVNESSTIRTADVDLKGFNGWYLVYQVVRAS